MIITSYNDEQGNKQKEVNLLFDSSTTEPCKIDGVINLWDNNDLLQTTEKKQENCSLGKMYSWNMKDTRKGRKDLEKELKKFYANT